MFKKILLSICLLLLTTVSSSEASFTPKINRPDDFSNLMGQAASRDLTQISKNDEKTLKDTANICQRISQYFLNEQFSNNGGLALDFSGRTAKNQIMADLIKLLRSAEGLFGKLEQKKNLDTLITYTDEPREFTARAKLMQEQIKHLREWLTEVRLLTGTDLAIQNQWTINTISSQYNDNVDNVKISW